MDWKLLRWSDADTESIERLTNEARVGSFNEKNSLSHLLQSDEDKWISIDDNSIHCLIQFALFYAKYESARYIEKIV